MYFFHFFRVYRCTAYLFILCLRYSKRVGWCAWQIVGCTPVHSMYLFVVTLKYVYRDAVHRLYTGCTQAAGLFHDRQQKRACRSSLSANNRCCRWLVVMLQQGFFTVRKMQKTDSKLKSKADRKSDIGKMIFLHQSVDKYFGDEYNKLE